jgi:hypothetical protein
LKDQKKNNDLTTVISEVVDIHTEEIRIPKLADAILELDRSLIR